MGKYRLVLMNRLHSKVQNESGGPKSITLGVVGWKADVVVGFLLLLFLCSLSPLGTWRHDWVLSWLISYNGGPHRSWAVSVIESLSASLSPPLSLSLSIYFYCNTMGVFVRLGPRLRGSFEYSTGRDWQSGTDEDLLGENGWNVVSILRNNRFVVVFFFTPWFNIFVV